MLVVPSHALILVSGVNRILPTTLQKRDTSLGYRGIFLSGYEESLYVSRVLAADLLAMSLRYINIVAMRTAMSPGVEINSNTERVYVFELALASLLSTLCALVISSFFRMLLSLLLTGVLATPLAPSRGLCRAPDWALGH